MVAYSATESQNNHESLVYHAPYATVAELANTSSAQEASHVQSPAM